MVFLKDVAVFADSVNRVLETSLSLLLKLVMG